MMSKVKYSDLSNSELKILIETFKNEFEGKKIKLKEICEEMANIEKQYIDAVNELNIRKNIYL
jgi:hypothetical protein